MPWKFCGVRLQPQLSGSHGCPLYTGVTVAPYGKVKDRISVPVLNVFACNGLVFTVCLEVRGGL